MSCHVPALAAGTAGGALAEILGMQRIRPLARTLGATPAYADELARIFWEGICPYVPARYRSERCRAGGPLDLRPQSPAWP